MSFYDAIRVGASGAADFEVERSLRFNSGDSAYLQNTPSSAGNRKTNTLSFWVKLGKSGISDSGTVASCNSSNSDTNNISVVIRDTGIRIVGYYNNFRITNRILRDPSAWYHIVVAIDTTQASADNRIKLYVNGVQETSFSTSGNVSQNANLGFAQASTTRIGARSNDGVGSYFDGYLAEVNFIDGQALTPSSFAETNAATGQWVPIDTSGLTFGTTGFYVKFADNSGTTATTLGKDSSGNGNNFTPNNFSVAAGAGNDSLEDTPTNNFCTLNPLDKMGTVTVSEGNLKVVINGDNASLITGSFGVSSGKWYYEAVADTAGAGFVGWIRKDVSTYTSYPYQQGGSLLYFSQNGSRYKDGDGGASYGASYTNGDIIGCAINLDDNEVTWYKNNASQGTISINAGTYNPNATTGGSSATFTFNFGQRAFSYTPPTGFKALNSANLPDPTIKLPNKHFGTLLWTGNATVRTISDTSQVNFTPDWVWVKCRTAGHDHQLTDSVRGSSKALAANLSEAEIDWDVLYSGNNKGMGDYVNGGFILDDNGNNARYNQNSQTFVAWNWNAGDTDSATYTVKVVSDSGNKYRFNDFGTSAVTLDLAEGGTYTFDGSDSSMSSHPFVIGTAANGSEYSTGVTYQLDGASVTYSQYTSGYSSATTRKLIITVPASAPVLYYWCSVHSGMGGQINTNSTLGSSNFAGSIQSTVKANTTAGFSIVGYTGNGSNGQTVGHGLGVAPDVIIVKARGATQNWRVWHKSLAADGSKRLILDQTNVSEDAGFLNDTAPTSTLFTLGNSDDAWNVNGGTYIAYLFSEVAGYSKFGKYTGNGSNDGTFIYTGFRPAFVLLKSTNLNVGWYLLDNKRDPDNVVSKYLRADSNVDEDDDEFVDFLSNGFKQRYSDTAGNGSGDSYIYFAFAESPFKNSRAR